MLLGDFNAHVGRCVKVHDDVNLALKERAG